MCHRATFRTERSIHEQSILRADELCCCKQMLGIITSPSRAAASHFTSTLTLTLSLNLTLAVSPDPFAHVETNQVPLSTLLFLPFAIN